MKICGLNKFVIIWLTITTSAKPFHTSYHRGQLDTALIESDFLQHAGATPDPAGCPGSGGCGGG